MYLRAENLSSVLRIKGGDGRHHASQHIHRQENQLITVFQRYCLSSIERWAFRLSKTPLFARFHSNGESGRLDEVRGRRRWVGVLVVVEFFLFYYRSHIVLCPCARGISAFD